MPELPEVETTVRDLKKNPALCAICNSLSLEGGVY